MVQTNLKNGFLYFLRGNRTVSMNLVGQPDLFVFVFTLENMVMIESGKKGIFNPPNASFTIKE